MWKLKQLICLTILTIITLNSNVNGLGIGDILTSAKDVGKGVVKDVGNLLPTPEGLFSSGKNLIAGYPFEFLSTTINQVCSSALSSNTIKPKVTPDIHKMQFQLLTPCQKYYFPLLDSDQMWKSPAFDPKKKVVIFVTGWISNANDSETIDTVAKAYHCRGNVNFIAVDSAGFIDTLYTWSAFNTEDIGQNIAVGLQQLLGLVPVQHIHLIGHSLGAHIVGAAGRNFNYMTGQTIPRITGLDPAKPCFNEGENLSGLLRGDADFIDVIHSDPGVLGKRDPLGDVDFYPGGLSPLPPGCVSITCAHARAWEYYAESVYPGNERNFMAKRCSSLTKLHEDKCPGDEYPMGYAVPYNLKGNYFLDINKESPYGKSGDKQRESSHEKCGSCEKKN